MDIATSFDAAFKSVQHHNESVRGEVLLGMSWTLSSYFAFPVIEHFNRQYPEIHIKLSEEPREALEQSLEDGELELALVLTCNLTPGTALKSKTFHKSKRQLWTSVGHPLAAQEAVTLLDVAQHPYALLKSDEADRQGLAHWNEAKGRPVIRFISRSIEAVRSMVAAGQAVIILSDMVYRQWTLDGRRVERTKLVEKIPTMDLGVAWKANRALSPAARLLRDAVYQRLSQS